jgi:hypothetical protein
MYFRIIAILLFLTLGVNAQTLHWVTNVQGTVASGPAFTLTGPVGSYRITYTVLDTLSPYVPVPMDDGSTFRLEIRDIHSFRIYNLTNTLGTDISPANGEIRHVIPSLGAGTYDVRGIATPANGNTNLNWRFTWHTLTVTSTPAQASVVNVSNRTIVVNEGGTNIESQVNNYFDYTATNNINLAGNAISNGLFVGDGSGLTNLPIAPTYANLYATNTPASAGNMLYASDTINSNLFWSAPPASGGATGMVHIATLVADGSVDAIEFTAIPQNYTALICYWSARVARTNNTTDSMYLFINEPGIKTFNNSHFFYLNTTLNTYSSTNNTAAGYVRIVGGSNATDGTWSGGHYTFYDYASTNSYKTIHFQFGGTRGTSEQGQYGIGYSVTRWFEAMTQIVFRTGSTSNFAGNSKFSLYGVTQ